MGRTDTLALAEDDVAPALRVTYPRGEVATKTNGPVVRVVEMARGTTEGGEELVTMRLKYHVPHRGRSRLLLARVNVPNTRSADDRAAAGSGASR